MTDQKTLVTNEDYDVYPVFLQDDLKSIHNVLSWLMLFNDILDPDRLHQSLAQLVQIGDWRKCAGRHDGKHEMHAPVSFDSERPAVNFTHSTIDSDFENHSHTSCIPRPSERASIQPLGPDVFHYAASNDTPSDVDGLVATDRSQISLHVTSFGDATLVAISWPHILTDVGGHIALMQSWSHVLAGRGDLVPPIFGAREDILQKVEDETTLEIRLVQSSAMSLTDKIRLGARLGFNFFCQPWVEDKLMFLPKNSLHRFISNTRAELAAAHPDAYITDGDILSAWAARTFARASRFSRPVTVIQMLGIRGKIPEIAHAKGVYMQNMLQAVYITLSVDVLRGPLFETALAHREQFVKQSTEGQVRSTLVDARQSIRNGKPPNMFFGPPSALILPINNLIKVDYFNTVDFTPAVVGNGQSKSPRANAPGTMSSWFNKPLDYKPGWLELFYLMGRDHGGNMWMKGVFRPQVWKVFEEELLRLDQT